jgi:hypothetical protein
MIYIKSLLAGLAALLTAALFACLFFFWTPVMNLMATREGHSDTYFILNWHLWPAVGISFLIFGIGFGWKYLLARGKH